MLNKGEKKPQTKKSSIPPRRPCLSVRPFNILSSSQKIDPCAVRVSGEWEVVSLGRVAVLVPGYIVIFSGRSW